MRPVPRAGWPRRCRPLAAVLALALVAAVALAVSGTPPARAADPLPPPPKPVDPEKLRALRDAAQAALRRSEPARVVPRTPTPAQVDKARRRREAAFKVGLRQFHDGGSRPSSREEQIAELTALIQQAPEILEEKAATWREALPTVREQIRQLLRDGPPTEGGEQAVEDWIAELKGLVDAVRRLLNIQRSAEVGIPAAKAQAKDPDLPERLVDEALQESGVQTEPTPPDEATPADDGGDLTAVEVGAGADGADQAVALASGWRPDPAADDDEPVVPGVPGVPGVPEITVGTGIGGQAGTIGDPVEPEADELVDVAGAPRPRLPKVSAGLGAVATTATITLGSSPYRGPAPPASDLPGLTGEPVLGDIEGGRGLPGLTHRDIEGEPPPAPDLVSIDNLDLSDLEGGKAPNGLGELTDLGGPIDVPAWHDLPDHLPPPRLPGLDGGPPLVGDLDELAA